MDLSEPLSEEEIQELDDYLMSEEMPDEAMDVSMLDGFLTALAIGPNTLPPSQWMPEVFGYEAEDEHAWASLQQAKRITGLIFRHANSIVFQLQEAPDTYEPLLFERDHEGRAIPIIDEWCAGFVKGMALDEASWHPLLESDAGGEMLDIILLYGTETGWKELEADPPDADQHEAHALQLPECVLAIYEWWLPLRKAKSTVKREEPKVGRNDLCPCGSGRKYKKCCGSPEKLH